jgi:uncharacterized protein (DUF58 family)
MRTREASADSLVNLSEIAEIELVIRKRMSEFAPGQHRSRIHGAGFDFGGLRDWEAGDRIAAIDWPQSSLTHFSPFIVRTFEQPSTGTIVAVADASLSTRCGLGPVSIASTIARAIATIGMSAVFFQDLFGLITFDEGFEHLAAVRAQVGRNHVVHCLDAYQHRRGLQKIQARGISMSLGSFMRKTSLIPVISDFLFDRPQPILSELSQLNATHDVFLVLIDCAFAYDLPAMSARWVEVADVETGRTRVLPRAVVEQLAQRAREWQDEVERMAKDSDLDVLRMGTDDSRNVAALTEFVATRRLRKDP